MNSSLSYKYPFVFLFFYAFIYAASSIFSTFMPVYLSSLKFTQTAIGTLLSVGPFIAIVAQPVWGAASDRAQYKNNVLRLIFIGNGLSIWLFYLSDNFFYIMAAIIVFTFFQIGITPASDTITLEYLDSTRWKFGPIRMFGTIGFAISAVATGILVKKNINLIFILYFVCISASFVTTFCMPKIKGHSLKNSKLSVTVLLKDRNLVVIMAFSLALSIISSFFSTFFSIYYKQIGASNSMLGWAIMIACLSEIPFLLFADKILHRFGTLYALVGSGIIMSIRLFLLYFIKNPYIILPLQLLHGFTFIVYSYSVAIYINKMAPKELKASGQALNSLIVMGVARIIGGMFGGFLSDRFGIRQMFLYSSFFTLIIVSLFVVIYTMHLKKHPGNA